MIYEILINAQPHGAVIEVDGVSVITEVKLMVNIQKGITGVSETSFTQFIKDINRFYADNNINGKFVIGKIRWVSESEFSYDFDGNDLIMWVGPNKGGYRGPPYFIVGVNTNPPFGFSSTGVKCEAQELAHYLGFQDLYWLSTVNPVAPKIIEIESDIMYDSYNPNAVFERNSRYVLNYNLQRIKVSGHQSILYPASRVAKGLIINTKIPNQICEIYTRERDYTLFKSKINSTPSLTKTTDSIGRFTMDIIGGDAVDNNFDVYVLKCNGKTFWLSSLAIEDCFIEQGPDSDCNIDCFESDSWCKYIKG